MTPRRSRLTHCRAGGRILLRGFLGVYVWNGGAALLQRGTATARPFEPYSGVLSVFMKRFWSGARHDFRRRRTVARFHLRGGCGRAQFESRRAGAFQAALQRRNAADHVEPGVGAATEDGGVAIPAVYGAPRRATCTTRKPIPRRPCATGPRPGSRLKRACADAGVVPT